MIANSKLQKAIIIFMIFSFLKVQDRTGYYYYDSLLVFTLFSETLVSLGLFALRIILPIFVIFTTTPFDTSADFCVPTC